MQPGRGRRDRALVLGEQRLVVAAIRARRPAAWRRYRAAAACRRARRWPDRAPPPWNANDSVTSPPSPFSSTVASSWPRKQTLPSSPKRTTSPGCKPFRRPHESAPARAVDALVQIGFDPRLLAAPDPPPGQPRRNDLGVVDHERVAGLEQIRQIAHDAIFDSRRRRPASPPAASPHRAATPAASAMRSGGRSKSKRIGAHRSSSPP